jgi:DNA processing protein
MSAPNACGDMSAPSACGGCLARPWLLSRLGGHLDLHRDRVEALLALSDRDLIAAVAGTHRSTIEHEYEQFDAARAREEAGAADLELVCRCHPDYPSTLAELEAPPAVLHVAGGYARLHRLLCDPPVAIVGSRDPSSYGKDVATTLARKLALVGFTVMSGMARGIDTAAHRGALELDRPTVAVLAGAAEVPYPASARRLHARIRLIGAVVSELPPGTRARRWMFPARNRLIAALSAMTVVVEGRSSSGSLITARFAKALGRPVGAVPGRITSPLAHGPHQLLRDGARLIERPEDVLETVYGPDSTHPWLTRPPVLSSLAPEAQALLDALAEGHGTAEALARAGLDAEHGLATLAALELAGRIRREAGGRYSVALA